MRKKESKGNKFRKSLNTWVCRECEEEWSDDDPHVWVECDACGKKYHLQCSDIQYKTKDYWKINPDNFQLECSEWIELFEGYQDSYSVRSRTPATLKHFAIVVYTSSRLILRVVIC